MNYSKIYNSLILSAAETPPGKGEYTETHHIIPRCLGGDDSSENLVKLTARQHFLAHWLLYKMYRTSALAFAWHGMCRVSQGQEERTISSHMYQYAKRARSDVMRISSIGAGNNFYGKTHTSEAKAKMSKAHTGKVYKTDAQIQEWVESVARKPKTDDHKSKIGRPGLGVLQNIHTKEIIRVPLSDERFSSGDWVNPRVLTPERKMKCLYCDVATTGSNLKRWHNENCKGKK